MLKPVVPLFSHEPSPRTHLLRQSVLAMEHAALAGIRKFLHTCGLSAHVAHRALAHRVRVTRNVPYHGSGNHAHLLDVFQPREASLTQPLPVVMYVHGGGFEVCSKDTHWMMAQQYAHAGFVVFNVNYRLAPKHSFPKPLEDVCNAYLWVLDNARRFGGDVRQIVIAGESAGANLVSSLALINAIERSEPYARAVFRRNTPPAAVVAACGLFEVVNASRFHALAKDSWPITRLAIEQVSRAYIPFHHRNERNHELANPLHLLEQRHTLHRPLAPFFVPCGTSDPLLDDTLRFTAALHARGVEHEARYYEGEIHAFHAMWWRTATKQCWSDTLSFIARQLRARDMQPSVAA
jgi:acetyl esterase